jgi:hypothetical protein
MTAIEVVLGDITHERVDAIVTAAATRSTSTSVERVRLVAFDTATQGLLQSALQT